MFQFLVTIPHAEGFETGLLFQCACAVRMVFALCCGVVGVPLQGAWAGCCLLWMAVQGAAVGFFSGTAGGVARGEWLLSRYVIVAKGHRIWPTLAK